MRLTSECVHSYPSSSSSRLYFPIAEPLVNNTRSLKRVRRQWRVICNGPDSFTSLIASLIDANREVIRLSEPLAVGDSERLGPIWLRNCRVYNLHTVKVREVLEGECNETTMNLVFKLNLDKPRVQFDWWGPLNGAASVGGQLWVTMDVLDLDIGLVTPKKKKKLGGRTEVSFLEVKRIANLKLDFRGMGPATTFATFALGLTHVFVPSVQNKLFEIILFRTVRNYVARTPLPL